ncbi:MAG: hypothetical protein JRD89_07990 [Deltaproteobacteria bacterium]|nr:hypothetical protein [Deltaproteobacteria bacterium]
MPPRITPDLKEFLLKCWDVAGTETFTYGDIDPAPRRYWRTFQKAHTDKWIECVGRQGHFKRLWKLTQRAIQQLGVG